MEITRKISGTVLITAVLVAVIAFCITGTVSGRSKNQDRVEEKYYKTMEKNYVGEIKSLLSEKGFKNSGVTMTRVTEGDGTRIYTVEIHNKRIDRLGSAKKQELREECSAIGFPVEECIFFHEFLETDL